MRHFSTVPLCNCPGPRNEKSNRRKRTRFRFHLEKRRSSRFPTKAVIDIDFADDIALLSEEINQAQELLDRVESEAAKVGVHLNADKTEATVFNHSTPVEIKKW